MEPQEGDIATGPNGEQAVFRGGQWVVQGQSNSWNVQRLQNPADDRQERRLDLSEEANARAARAEEMRVQNDSRDSVRRDVASETDLRKEFTSLPDVKDFPAISRAYGNIVSTANNQSAAGDLSLIFAFMKILDPTSVVRETEFANAQNAAGVPDQIRNLFNRVRNGERLNPQQRADFVAQARSVYTNSATAYNEQAQRYRGLAEAYGYTPDNVALVEQISTDPVSVNRQPATESPNELSAQGYKYDGERDVWYRPVNQNPEQIVEAARQADGTGIGRQINAVGRGIADAATFGFADEIAAGLNTVIPADRGSRAFWQAGEDVGSAYSHNLQQQRAIDQADRQDVGAARLTGQIAGGLAAPGAVAGGRFIAAAPNLMTAGVRGAQVGAAAGGAYAAGSAQGGLMERAQAAGGGAAVGALTGAPLAAGGRAVGSAIGSRLMTSPRAQAVSTLQNNGVSLTPGQMIGGPVQTVENLAQRAPILGPAIRGARERGVESLNRAVGNRALDAIGEGVPASVNVGSDMVGHVGDRLGAQFERGYGMIGRFQADDGLIQGLQAVGQGKSDLPPAMQQQFDDIIRSRLARLEGGDVSGAQVGAIRSELNGIAAGYLRSGDPAQQGLGRLLSGVTDELDAAVGRANPEAGAVLSQARDGYADFIRLERASTSAGGRPFSPGQLETAVRASDGSVRRGAVGRGEARMQDLSSAARSIMPDQFGNPGTADAVGLGGLGVGMVTEPVTTMGVAAGLGAASIPYLAMGRKIVERLPANASRAELETAASLLDDLARNDSNVIVLRDAVARRIGRTVPAVAQQAAPEPPRLMTGTRPR